MSGCRDVGMYEFGKCNIPLSEHDLDLHYKPTATIDVHLFPSTIGTVTIRVKGRQRNLLLETHKFEQLPQNPS